MKANIYTQFQFKDKIETNQTSIVEIRTKQINQKRREGIENTINQGDFCVI